MTKQTSNYRWVVFVTVLFTYFLIVSQRTAPGLITDQLMKHFHVTAATIGLLASIQFLAYASLQIPIGIFSDRWGPNIFLIVGTLLTGIGTVLYSLAPNEVILSFARLIVGMGDATIWVNLVLILSQWFMAQEFISLLGFAGVSGSLGFLLATVPFSAWLAATTWRIPFLTVGLILCGLGVLLYFILVTFPKRTIGDISLINPPPIHEHDRLENPLKILSRTVTERQAWATFFCHFGLVGTYVGFIGSWAVPYGMNMYGMSRSHASQLIMVGLIGAIIGAPLMSYIAKKVGSIKRPYTLVHFIVFLCWLMFFILNGKPPFSLLIILFLLIGYGNGSSALTFAIVRQSFNIKEIGVVSGFANTGGFISAILLPSIFGKILDHFSSSLATGFHLGFIIPVVFSMLGLVGGLLIKEFPQEVERVSDVKAKV